MSDTSSRPSVPRPISRVLNEPKAYVNDPPVIRERLETLDLEDADIVESEPLTRRSNPPPPPPSSHSRPIQSVVADPVVSNFIPVETIAIDFVRDRETEPAPEPWARPIPPPPESTVAVRPRGTNSTVPVTEPVRDSVFDLGSNDPADLLFDGMYELNFVDSIHQAAAVCAAALAKALGARAVVIHVHDLARRQLRAIAAHGENAHAVIGTVEPTDDDLLGSAVVCNEGAVTMRFDGELPRVAPRRLSVVGAPRQVVAVPAIAWGRCLAMIEVIDADERFEPGVTHNAAYVADRLAEFLSDRAA